MTRDSEVAAALPAIRAGGAAAELESFTLDFMEQGRSVDDTIRDAVDAALCFANSGGGVIVVGVANRPGGVGGLQGNNYRSRATEAADLRIDSHPSGTPAQPTGLAVPPESR